MNGNGGRNAEDDPRVAMIKMMMNMGDLFKPNLMLYLAKRVRLINYTRYCEYFAEIPAMNTEMNDETFNDFNNIVLLARYMKASFSTKYYELLIEYLRCLEFDFDQPVRTGAKANSKSSGKSSGKRSGLGMGMGSGPGLMSSLSMGSLSLVGGANVAKEPYIEPYRQLSKFKYGFNNPPPKPEGIPIPNGPRCREGFMDKYLFYPYVKYKCKVENPLARKENTPFLDVFFLERTTKLVAGLSEEFITKFIAYTSAPTEKNKQNAKNKEKAKEEEEENLVENEGNGEAKKEDASGIQERIYNFLDMINEMSMFQLNDFVVIARRSFSIPIPYNVGGLKFKAMIMSLMVIFKPRGFGKIVKEKLSGAERDMLRIPLGENDIKETALRMRLSKTLDPTTQANLIKSCIAYPLKDGEDVERWIPEAWRANPSKVMILLFMLQSFYLTHFPKQIDTDRLPKLLPRLRFDPETNKSIIQYSGKPGGNEGNGSGKSMNIPTKKKKLDEKSGVIYAEFVQAKAMITLFTKYTLKYFYLLDLGEDPKNQARFWNLFIHLIYGLFSPKPETNFLDRGFKIGEFQVKGKESIILPNATWNGGPTQITLELNPPGRVVSLNEAMNQLTMMIFGPSAGNDGADLVTQIYEEVWAGDAGKAKRELLRLSENSSANFITFFKKLFGRKYMMYLAQGNLDNIGRFAGITSKVPMQKPSFYSIHKLRLGSDEATRFNSLLLRTKWNETRSGTSENKNKNKNKSKNTLNNYQVIKGKNREKRYNAETQKQVIAQMKEKMANENRIAQNIRKNNNAFVWTEGMGPKFKEGLELEIFLLLTYKKYLRNIFRLLTSHMDPLAVEILAKV